MQAASSEIFMQQQPKSFELFASSDQAHPFSPSENSTKPLPFNLKKITLKNNTKPQSFVSKNVQNPSPINSNPNHQKISLDSSSDLLPELDSHPTLCGRKIKYYTFPDSRIPIFVPDEEQFSNFSLFIQAIDKLGSRAGLAKVIPPISWRRELELKISKISYPYLKPNIASPNSKTLSQPESVPLKGSLPQSHPNSNGSEAYNFPSSNKTLETQPSTQNQPDDTVAEFYDDEFPDFRPIVQLFDSRKGIYRQYNVEYRKKRMDLSEFFSHAQQPGHCMPEIRPSGSPSRNNSHRTHSKNSTSSPDFTTSNPESNPDIDLKTLISENTPPDNGIRVDYKNGLIQLVGTNPISSKLSASKEKSSKNLRKNSKSSIVKYISADQCDTQYLYIDNKDLDLYNEIERTYWRNLLIESPMYGADVAGSLFPSVKEFPNWNIRNLKSILNKVKLEISGVTLPYLYVGAWKSTFAWHVEDMDLYSINYVHFGAPKAWFSINQSDCARFERCAQATFADDFKKCKQFLRHKSFHMSPKYLASQGIKVNRVVQNAGEFMITFPFGYHSGFNYGFNCAESTNFALEKWVQIGRNSEYCKCIPDSVKIDVDHWFDIEPREPIKTENLDTEPTSPSKISPSKRTTKSTPISASKRRKKPLPSSTLDSENAEISDDPPAVAVINHFGFTSCCYAPTSSNDSVVPCETCGIKVHRDLLQNSPPSFNNNINTTAASTDSFSCLSCEQSKSSKLCIFCGCSGGFLVPILQKANTKRRISKRILEKLNHSLYGHYHCAHFSNQASIIFRSVISQENDNLINRDESVNQTIDIEALSDEQSTQDFQHSSSSDKALESVINQGIPQNRYSCYITLSSGTGTLKTSSKCQLCKKSHRKITSTFVKCSHPGCSNIIHPTCAVNSQTLPSYPNDPLDTDKIASNCESKLYVGGRFNWNESKLFCDEHLI